MEEHNHGSLKTEGYGFTENLHSALSDIGKYLAEAERQKEVKEELHMEVNNVMNNFYDFEMMAGELSKNVGNKCGVLWSTKRLSY